MNTTRGTIKTILPAWVLVLCALSGANAASPAEDAVITSDELELINNGAKTIFSGHVILTQDPYRLTADRMVRTKATSLVDVHGNIHGMWITEQGEKVLAEGDDGLYNPVAQTTELWGHARLTRWQTLRDTSPVTVTAGHFTAHHRDKTVWAKKDVHMQQGPGSWALSDEAKFDQKEQVLYLWGTRRTHVHWENAKGIAAFESDHARIYLSPKHVQLKDRVKGHIIPL